MTQGKEAMNTKHNLKAIAILICSGLTGVAAADDMMGNTSTQSDSQAGQIVTQPIKEGSDTSGMQNSQEDTNSSAIQGDAEITKDVSMALSDYTNQIQIQINSGVVSLQGQLPSDTDYERVITMAESVKGVSDVNADKLTVQDSTAPLSDLYTTAKVKGALIREDVMGKYIPAWTVNVETKNGTVYLSGFVINDDQMQKILSAVQQVKGVNQVDNKLVVSAVQPTDNNSGNEDASSMMNKTNPSNNDQENSDTSTSDVGSDLNGTANSSPDDATNNDTMPSTNKE
jgi:hyperosmotically inducible periplasmic protein